MPESEKLNSNIVRLKKICAFIMTHNPKISELVAAKLQNLKDAEPYLTEQQIAWFLENLVNQAQQLAEVIQQATVEHGRETTEDKIKRKKVSSGAYAGYVTIRDFKSAAKGVYSQEFINDLGLSGHTPRNPTRVFLLLNLLLNWLLDPQKEFPPPINSMSEPLNKERIANKIVPVHSNLKSIIESYEHEIKETEDAMLVKNNAIREFEAFLKVLTGLGYYMMKLAGMNERAERLNPTVPRKAPKIKDQPDS